MTDTTADTKEQRMVRAHQLGARYYREHMGYVHGLAMIDGDDERDAYRAGYRGAMQRTLHQRVERE